MFTIAGLHGQRAVTHISLAILAALALAGSARAQVGLGLAPMREELKLASGAAHSGVLTLANDASPKVRCKTELLDFYLDATGTPQFGGYPREAEFSCRQWLVANPMELELN